MSTTVNFAPKVWRRPHTSTYPINWKYGKGLYEPVVESLGNTSKMSYPGSNASTVSSIGTDWSSIRSAPLMRAFDRFHRSTSIVGLSDVARFEDTFDSDEISIIGSRGLYRSKSQASIPSSQDRIRKSMIEVDRLKRRRWMNDGVRSYKRY